MDKITEAHRLAALLRSRLEERRKSVGSSKAASPADGRQRSAEAKTSGVRAMAALGSTSDRALRRAVIQDMLAERLGNSLLNDAQFQQIVARVTDAIDADPVSSQLLTHLIGDIMKA